MSEELHPILARRNEERKARYASGELKPIAPGPNGMTSYGLVRGKDGKPRVDNLHEMPKQIWDSLSQEDQEYLESIHGEYVPRFL